MNEHDERDTAEYPTLPVAPPDPIAPLRVEVAALTHPGLVREENEDAFAAIRLSRRLDALATSLAADELPGPGEADGYALAVADGLGGHSAGERASRLAIRTGLELILASTNWALRMDDYESSRLRRRLRDYFVAIDHAIRDVADRDPALKGMATTLTVAYTVGRHGFVVHVGDTRAYRLRDGVLTRLTRDHTLAQALADAGEIDPSEVRRHGRRHVLTNVLSGRSVAVNPDVNAFDLAPGDALVLCSDGLHDIVDDAEITAELTVAATPGAACDALLKRALDAGGGDNITVLIARYSDAG